MDEQPTGAGEDPVVSLLLGYVAGDSIEAADVARVGGLLRTAVDPWSRGTQLHLTASALIVHPASGRVLLRWHQRQQAWLQVGGHGDPGEREPLAIALREAREETGLADLLPWPGPALVHLAIVPVAAGRGEPEHEHADLRFLLATDQPETAVAESADAPLRWLSASGAAEITAQANLRVTLARAADLMGTARTTAAD